MLTMSKLICLLFFIVILTSCKKPNNPAPSTTTNNNYLFYGQTPSSILSWTQGVNNAQDLPGIGTGPANNYSSSFLTSFSSPPTMSIKFILPEISPTQADYNSFFKPSTISFDTENTPNSVFFYYVDSTGQSWGTGLGSQTNSYFTISSVESVNGYTLVVATFQCNLYNSSNGTTSLSLKSGKAQCLIPQY